MPAIENAKLKEIYTAMVRTRAFEERLIAEYHKGNIPGFIHSAVGQEAIPAAVCAFLREDDYAYPTHRGHGVYVARGARIDGMMAEFFAKETGCAKGKGGLHLAAADLNILGVNGIVGDNIPISSGVALGCKMQKLNRVVACFFGDGATNSGAFHEGVGLAAIWELPVVFVCENNQYQQSTPMKNYTKLKDLSERARGYGIPGVTVDGNDAVAIAEIARQAIEDVRGGSGPILIVGNTYRYYGHHMGDPSTSYRNKEEVEEWKRRDAIARFRTYLLQKEIATESELEEIHAATEQELDEAVKFAIESPEPGLEEALKDNYYTAGER